MKADTLKRERSVCFGCRLGHEIFYYMHTKTSVTTGYENENRKTKGTYDVSVDDIFPPSDSYNSARETSCRKGGRL